MARASAQVAIVMSVVTAFPGCESPTIIIGRSPALGIAESTKGIVERKFGPVPWHRARAGFSYRSVTPYHLPVSSELTTRKAGGQLLVPIYVDGQQILVFSISELATHLRVEENGDVGPIPNGSLYGQPMLWSETLPSWPLTPEFVVRWLGSRAGTRIRTLPELVRYPKAFAPVFAMWRLRLDRDVTFERMDGSVVRRGTAYVGIWLVDGQVVPQTFIEKEDQPAYDVQLRGGEETRLYRREGYPLDYEPVAIGR